MSRLLLGVDAGGTRTAAAAARDGQVVGRATGLPGAVRPGRALVAASAIADTARRALDHTGARVADVLLVGAAGAGRETEREELRQALRGEGIARTVTVTTDVALALAAAFRNEPGIVLAAGTGSIALARAPGGAISRAGGYGWQMGDEGSGYAVGRAALEAAGRARDGRGPETALTALLPAAARCESFEALVAWSVTAIPTAVASLAPAVLAAAATDGVARRIRDGAAAELAVLAVALRGHVALDPVPVALAGGLASDPGYRSAVVRVLLAAAGAPALRPLDDAVDPVAGALWLADREPS